MLTLWRAGDADGGGASDASYEFWLAGPDNESLPDLFDQCVLNLDVPDWVWAIPRDLCPQSNRVLVPQANLGTHLYVNASCGGGAGSSNAQPATGDANHYAAVVYLYAADIVLEQMPARRRVT